MTLVTFNQTKRLFLEREYSLKRFEKILNSWNTVHIPNAKLKQAASRLQIPEPFYPYIQYVEETQKIKFPEDLKYTHDEVLNSDLECIERFSNSNFDHSKLNLDDLIRSAVKTAKELGIERTDGRFHSKSTLDISLESFPNNTSSGYPLFRQKGTEYARQDVRDWINKYVERPTVSELMKQPSAVFHRFQYKYNIFEDTLIKKVRQIWGLPYRVVTLEGIYFRSMVDYCTLKNQNGFAYATWGRTLPNLSKQLLPKLRSHKKRLITIDSKQFDSSVPSFMWCLFYSIIAQTISLNEEFDSKILEQLMVYHNYTPFCFKSTVVQYQKKGVPSGSLITSLFNSFVNRTVINYACLEYTNGSKFAEDTASVLGDDSLISETYISYKHVVNVYNRFGFIINLDKSGVVRHNERVEFLGYIWDENDRPTQHKDWYISHLCMPSRFLRNETIPISLLQTYRAITICMVLYKGIDIFERLIGNKDVVWKNLKDLYYMKLQDPLIEWISEDQRKRGYRIPLSVILHQGWEAFG